MHTLQLSAHWTGEALDFVGIDTKGLQLNMGGDNFRPSQLLLLGLAGCTGMDVVSILQKKRQTITGVEVQVTAHQPDEYPKPFQVVELNFVVKGDNLDPQAVERAIELSRDKYCVVGQTLEHEVEIKTSFTIEA